MATTNRRHLEENEDHLEENEDHPAENEVLRSLKTSFDSCRKNSKDCSNLRRKSKKGKGKGEKIRWVVHEVVEYGEGIQGGNKRYKKKRSTMSNKDMVIFGRKYSPGVVAREKGDEGVDGH